MPVISINVAANTALRYLNLNSSQESSSLSKLASGSRITKASDDAAGLAIGTQLQSDITVLSQAATNASHATTILQTADGGLAHISDITQRMRSLAIQSASDTVTDPERAYIASEFNELSKEITDIAKNTRYNNTSLLDGSFKATFQVGTASSDSIAVSLEDSTAKALGLDELDVATKEGAESAQKAMDKAISQLTQQRAAVGATESRFNFSSASIATTNENTQAAQSVIMDADVASEKTRLACANIRAQAAIAALSQANQLPGELLSLLK